MPDALWLNKWFLTLFLYSFPLGLCIRIWDNILADGSKFIFKVSLAILKLTEADLLKLDFNGINDYFKLFNGRDEEYIDQLRSSSSPLPDFETIILEAHKFNKITDQVIRLESSYNVGNPSQKPERSATTGK